MKQEELKNRTKKFNITTILALRGIKRNEETEVFKYQLIKASSSVGANYRSCCRAKSKADFINKLKIVEEEADECCYWLEILIDLYPEKETTLKPILKEANELTAIFTKAGQTARGNK
ncbi:MAG: four helix bundle protein [Bacteroidota bacterium]